jgi:hypothetical protein
VSESWFETKVKFVVAQAMQRLNDPATKPMDRQEIAMDLVRAAGELMEPRHAGLLALLVGDVLSVLPAARRHAEGDWRTKLDQLQEILLDVKVTADRIHKRRV